MPGKRRKFGLARGTSYAAAESTRRETARAGAQFTSKSESTGATAETTISANSSKVALRYEVKADRHTGAIKSETLLINGKRADLDRGALLLIDLSGPAATWRQVRASFPAVPYQSKPEAVTTAAKDVLRSLSTQSADVRAFTR